ncbi:MAG: hypothetical protein JO112_04140 [Planctomycetes bacterium]|nr:hypothetical protein [Planctomycetota bacterium]
MPKRWIVWFLVAMALPLGTPRWGTASVSQLSGFEVTVDTSEVPDLAGWGRQAKELAQKWHPRIAKLLQSDGFTPPQKVTIVFKKSMRGIAYTRGTTIVIAADWVRSHPDDFGMVIHELTHTIQGYRRGGPSWLVEGIADYVRFCHFEPETPVIVNPRRASYRDGYRTTGRFLGWVEKTYDRDIVRQLNNSLRKGEYTDDLFQTYTSHSLDELWADFVSSQAPK